MTSEDVRLRIDRARWWALTEQPFYGSLAMSLTDVIDPRVPTAATDGQVIRWNPGFVAKLTEQEVRFVLLHETLHCAHLHPWRLPEDLVGNQAGDHEINLTLQNVAGVSMPEGGLCDPQYKELACEEIHKRLASRPPAPAENRETGDDGQAGGEEESGTDGNLGGQDDSESDPGDKEDDQGADESEESDDGADGDEEEDSQEQDGGPGDEEEGDEDDGEGAGAGDDGDQSESESEGSGEGDGEGEEPAKEPVADPCGSFTAPSVESQTERQDLCDDWEGKVIQAAQAAQALGRGDIPEDMERVLDRVRHQTIDWRRETADFLRDAVGARNDWMRCARRHAWQPVIYPRRRPDDLGLVVFARDTSGSISDEVCAEATELISDCLQQTGCRGLVFDADARIQAEYWLEPGDRCPVKAQGRGGTDFRPVFNRVEELAENGEQIAGVIYLTDLYGPEPESCDIPTLWLCTTKNKTARFGRTVFLERPV